MRLHINLNGNMWFWLIASRAVYCLAAEFSVHDKTLTGMIRLIFLWLRDKTKLIINTVLKKYIWLIAFTSLLVQPLSASASSRTAFSGDSNNLYPKESHDQRSRKSCKAVEKALSLSLDCQILHVSSLNLTDFERALQLGAIYASKFVPTLN